MPDEELLPLPVVIIVVVIGVVGFALACVMSLVFGVVVLGMHEEVSLWLPEMATHASAMLPMLW